MAKTTTTRGNLADRMAKKPAASTPAPVPDGPAVAAPAAAAGSKDDRVQIIVRMTLAERKALRHIALDKDTTVQALAEEAIRDVLRRHGR